MNNPGLPMELWRKLDGGLWHATSINSLINIKKSGCIAWNSSGRYRNYFCRECGGVSLFDFGESAIDKWDQLKNWSGWFGLEQNTRIAVWLCIDRAAVRCGLMDASASLQEWRGQRSRRFIPGVEACHIGNISLSAIEGFLLIDRYDLASFQWIGEGWRERIGEIGIFEQSRPPKPTHGLGARLNAARLARRAALDD